MEEITFVTTFDLLQKAHHAHFLFVEVAARKAAHVIRGVDELDQLARRSLGIVQPLARHQSLRDHGVSHERVLLDRKTMSVGKRNDVVRRGPAVQRQRAYSAARGATVETVAAMERERMTEWRGGRENCP